jgi:hypothetical protein
MGFYDYGLLDEESAAYAPTFRAGAKSAVKTVF